jgi:hypothetical protein
MYDSDMTVYLDDIKRSPERRRIVEQNIALMKQWEKEGR